MKVLDTQVIVLDLGCGYGVGEVVILYRILFFLHAFVGVGALGGGLGAILNPEGPMGISTELLKGSPFNNYLIPGVILFVVIGIGNIISALMLRSKARFHLYISSVFSWALVIWIVVQCIIMGAVHFLHMIYFIIGVIEVTISTRLIFKENLYPSQIITDFYQKFKG